MENLLDLYHRPYDPKRPLLAMDEHPVQLTGETRIPVPEKPGHPRRYDYEYERNGTAANFLFLEPLTGRRKVHVRERRTAVDWAYEIQELLEVDYPDAQVVVLVCDNLSTHTIASSSRAGVSESADRIAPRNVFASTFSWKEAPCGFRRRSRDPSWAGILKRDGPLAPESPTGHRILPVCDFIQESGQIGCGTFRKATVGGYMG